MLFHLVSDRRAADHPAEVPEVPAQQQLGDPGTAKQPTHRRSPSAGGSPWREKEERIAQTIVTDEMFEASSHPPILTVFNLSKLRRAPTPNDALAA